MGLSRPVRVRAVEMTFWTPPRRNPPASLGSRWSPPVLVVLILGFAAAAAVLPPAGHASGSPPPVAPCASVLSNSTLLGAVDRFYQYPNGSLLPSRSTAENSTLDTWSAICGSSAFATAYENTTNRTLGVSVAVGDQNRTASGELIGSLFATFSLTGAVTCPVGVSGFPSGYPCSEADTWMANLSLSAVTGHRSSVISDRFVPCQTPEQNQTNLGTVSQFYPNPAQVPNESVAQAEVTVLWGGVCTTSAYYAAFWAHGTNLSLSAWTTVGGMNSTPDLFVQWAIYWQADPCPQAPPSGAGANTCEVTESWTADLRTNSYTGPTFGYSYPMNGSGAPPLGTGGDGKGPGSPSGGGFFGLPSAPLASLALLLAVVGAGALVGTLSWRGARGPRLGRPSAKYSAYAALAREGSRVQIPSGEGLEPTSERGEGLGARPPTSQSPPPK